MTETLVSVAFSNPFAMPWHQAVLGELQYRLSCACASDGTRATPKAANIGTRSRRFIVSGMS
jgi:hypothetical protein